MRRTVLFVFLAGFTLGLPVASHAQEKADEIVAPSAAVAGGKVLEWTTPEGRPYWYRVPKKIKASAPPALILMLHGTGMPHGWAFWNYSIAGGTFRADDIIVSPDGLTPGNGAFNFVQGKKDGDQIAGLIHLFREEFPIGRVYLYGHSQGAFFAYWFAGEDPQLVDGIIAHAGNVLDVKHSDFARDKVAIGILHGKADAVVSVECAYRTHDIYQQEGYKKLKLYVVEGLTETSGHWPLPQQVLEMLQWLDEVSVKTAWQAVEMAMVQFDAAQPSLEGMLAAQLEARVLLKKYQGEDKALLAGKVVLLDEFLALALQAHQDAVAEPALDFSSKSEFAAWMVHFVAANRVFANDRLWTKTFKKVQGQAGKHSKAVDKALDALGKAVNKKNFSTAVQALEADFLSARYEELAGQLARIVENSPKDLAPKDCATLAEILSSRSEARNTGRENFLATTATAAKEFRATHADAFPATEE